MERDSALYLRQLDIFDVSRAHVPVTVIGAGSLGSWLVLGLAKLGFDNITVYDFDSVALHNIPNQFYTMRDGDEEVGPELKVEALRRLVDFFSGVEIAIRPEKFQAQPLEGIIIATPDNMATRKSVFMRCTENSRVLRFLDGRMGGQSYRTYAIDPNDHAQRDFYLKRWYPDEAGAEEKCTERGVVYNAVACAMDLVNLTKRFVMGQEVPREIVVDSGGLWREVTW